jgi:hypothetical protein
MTLTCDWTHGRRAAADATRRPISPHAIAPILRAGVLAHDICRRGAVAHVAAVFDRSFYLRCGDLFVCVGEPAIGNGPLTLITDPAKRLSDLGLQPGRPASISARRVAIDDAVLFALDHCETWRPPAWSAAPSPARLLETCATLARRAAIEAPLEGLAGSIFSKDETPLARVARPRIARFEAWLSGALLLPTPDSSCPAQAGHPVIAKAEILSRRWRLLDRPPSRTMTTGGLSAVAGLIGLGPGLTPSGDDFLIGALALLDALAQRKIHAALGRAVTDVAPGLTSPLSACLLDAAAAGHTGEHLHRAVASVIAGNVAAATAAVRGIGHTSGWDMLAGIATTLRVVAADRGRAKH